MVDIKYRLGEKTLRENGKQMIGLSFWPIREWEVLNGRDRERRERERGREREREREREEAEGRQAEIRPIREWEVLNGRGGKRQTGGDICVNKWQLNMLKKIIKTHTAKLDFCLYYRTYYFYETLSVTNHERRVIASSINFVPLTSRSH